MKRYLIPFAVVLLLVGFCIWWYSPRQVIQRRTHSLLETLTFEKGGGLASRNMGGYTLHDLLAGEVQLVTPTIPEANGSFSRDDLEAAYSWLANQAKESRFEMDEIHDIAVQENAATVKFSLFGMVELPTYRPADGNYDVTFEWVKEEDGWKLARAVWDKRP
ncbi:MAG: hypothetical protein V4640_13730 [Verrucomicrobiota bacterium]